LRKIYTAVPLDKPSPVTGERKEWVPYLRVRPAKGHTILRSPLLAIVDSGSWYCLFRSDIAESIGIRDITTGKSGPMRGVRKGMEDTFYFHQIQLYIESDWKIDVMAGFSPNLSVPALLGRNGFFDHFLVTFDHSADPPVIEVSRLGRPA